MSIKDGSSKALKLCLNTEYLTVDSFSFQMNVKDGSTNIEIPNNYNWRTQILPSAIKTTICMITVKPSGLRAKMVQKHKKQKNLYLKHISSMCITLNQWQQNTNM